MFCLLFFLGCFFCVLFFLFVELGVVCVEVGVVWYGFCGLVVGGFGVVFDVGISYYCCGVVGVYCVV